MQVAVYCNIRTHKLSVKALEGDMKGRVIAAVERLMLKDATFKVSEAGRDRVRETGVKNVHAMIIGEFVAGWGVEVRGDPDNDTRLALSQGSFRQWKGGTRVTYNPYENDGFVRVKGSKTLVSADAVLLDRCKVEAHNPVNAS